MRRLFKEYGEEMNELKKRIALHRSGRFSPGYLRKKAMQDIRNKVTKTRAKQKARAKIAIKSPNSLSPGDGISRYSDH